MTERPTDYDSLVAAVRAEVEILRAEVPDVILDECGRAASFIEDAADRLAALLPPAKERVPWHEAKGRTVDGKEVTSVHDTYAGTTYFLADRFGGKVDPDGMVEVDAL